MEQRVTVELERREGRTLEELVAAVERTGARMVPGFDPVPMAGSPPSVCLTVVVGDAEVERRLRELPDLVQLWSDARVEPFGSDAMGGGRI